MPKYRYLGNHAQTIPVGDKLVPIEPGGFIDLNAKDVEGSNHLKELAESNLLVPADSELLSPKEQPQTSAQEGEKDAK